MKPSITILYAYRNRDARRVKLSLLSLQQQTTQGFEVVFVDYGSEAAYAQAVEEVVNTFDFTSYHYVGHPGLLWNKSKALNYGIRRAKGDYVFIADVDVLFHPETMHLFQNIAHQKTAYLFHLSYLSQKVTELLDTETNFFELPMKHTGAVNGMVLTSKKSLFDIHGVDEFFHFYGSEDVDLFQRLEFAGQQLVQRPELYFLHQWHTIYNSYDDSKLSITPRLFNIKRINQQHFFYHKAATIVKPNLSEAWGQVVKSSDLEQLQHPDEVYQISNHHAKVIHFLKVVLPAFKNGVLKLEVRDDDYRYSFKYKLKKFLKKESQPYSSIKDVNDLILSEIIYNYRDHNYQYVVHKDLKGVTFSIQKDKR